MPPPTTRSAWSCENCRRRKVKCNTRDPCSHCTRRGEHCRWPGSAQRTSPYPGQVPLQPQNVAQLQVRVERIESALAQAGLSLNFPGQSFPGRQEYASASTPSSQQQRVEIRELAEVSQDGPLRLDVHLHEGFDHHIISTSAARIDGNHPQNLEPSRASRTAARSEALRLIRRVLPGQQRCDELLHSYLHNVEWIHHPLHVPTFRAEYETFWEHYNQPRDDQHNLQWMALLMVVLCLGSHFDPQRPSLQLAEELYAASHELLTHSNYLANHSTTAIQTLILMGLWLNDRGLSSTHHAHLALAIKMAVNLGCSKLDAAASVSASFTGEDDGFFSVDRDVSRTQCDTEREIRRRLWWSLVCQDYYTASSCNFTYSIHPKQSKAHLFLNVDDEELQSNSTDNSTMTGHSLQDVATAASYHLLKIPFARVAKAMVDLYNDDALSYSAILDVERLLWATYDKLPVYFKWSRPTESLTPIPASRHAVRDHLEWQRLFLGFTVHNRVLRLHRPFLAHGYVKASMAHSRQATIDSALACLDLANHGQRIGFPGLRWWVILIHMFTAGVALCVDYHFLLQHHIQVHKDGAAIIEPSLLELRREQIARIVELLRPGGSSSIAAARAAAVIDGLIEQADSHWRGAAMSDGENPSSRRQRVEDSRTRPALAPPSSTNEHISMRPTTTSEAAQPPSFFMPVADDWPDTVDFDDWAGPNWDQLFASLSEDHSHLSEGMSVEVLETMNAFADSFATT